MSHSTSHPNPPHRNREGVRNRTLSSGLILLLMFPVIGVFGMIFILLTNALNNAEETPAAQAYPTPVSIQVTNRPTVVIVPVLDNPVTDTPFKDLAGNSHTLLDYPGKIVVVNFWATWCPPCVREMPALQTFAQENPDVVVLSITDPNDGQTLQDIEQFIADYQLTDIQIGLDERSLLKGFMSVVNLPTTYVIDRAGVVRFRQIGEVTTADLTYYLEELQ